MTESTSALPMTASASARPAERLLIHLASFARALRRVGLAVSPEKLVNAVLAVGSGGHLPAQRPVLGAALGFRQTAPTSGSSSTRSSSSSGAIPGLLKAAAGDTAPQGEGWQPLSRRVAEALLQEPDRAREPAAVESELDARMTWSSREHLKSRDFEEMSGDEFTEAQAAVRSMAPLVKPIPGRRFQPHPRGTRIDMRKTLRASMRTGADIIPLVRIRQRDRPPGFVVLCGHIRLHVHLLACLSALRACLDAPIRARVDLPVRDPALQRQPLPARQGRGPCPGRSRAPGEGLGGGHPNRSVSARIQSRMVAAGPGPGAHRASGQRRTGPRRRRGAGPRSRTSSQVVPDPDLAQPAAALRQVPAPGGRHQGDPAPCG